MKKYKCTVCDYEFESETHPEICPVCGADGTLIEEVTSVAS